MPASRLPKNVRRPVPRLRRGSSPEAVPEEPAVEIGDPAEGPRLDVSVEEHLVGGPPAPASMRPVAVVPEEEIGAETVDLADAREEPEAGEEGLLERPEDPLDPPVRPWMGRECEDVADAVGREEGCDRRRAIRRAAIGEAALRSAILLDRCREDVSDLHARSAAEPLECDESAAVVLDDSQDPDRDEAEHEDEGEVRAPDLTGAADADPFRPPAPRLPEGCHEVLAANEDAAKGLAGGVEAEDAAGEEAKLAGAEMGLLYMESDHLLLDVIRGAVPGAVLAQGRERREAMAEKPARRAPRHRRTRRGSRRRWSSTKRASRRRSRMTARQIRSWARRRTCMMDLGNEAGMR
jgi:hypothetical protein